MKQYTVTAERGDTAWALQCVEVPGAISQVDELEDSDGHGHGAEVIREAIAWVADVPEDEIEISLHVKGRGRVYRDDIWYMVEIFKIQRGHNALTQAYSPEEVEQTAKDLMATVLDLEVSQVSVDLTWE